MQWPFKTTVSFVAPYGKVVRVQYAVSAMSASEAQIELRQRLLGEEVCYPPLAAVLRSGADPSSVSTGANTVICTGARDGRCDERS